MCSGVYYITESFYSSVFLVLFSSKHIWGEKNVNDLEAKPLIKTSLKL